jgi:vacuolar-type H+-ATPase subunit E/Vma4
MKANDEFYIDNSAAIIHEMEQKADAEINAIIAKTETEVKTKEESAVAEAADIRKKALHDTDVAVKLMKEHKARNLESEKKRMLLIEKENVIRKVLEKTHNLFAALKNDPRLADIMVSATEEGLKSISGPVKVKVRPDIAAPIEKYMKEKSNRKYAIIRDEKTNGVILMDESEHLICDITLEGIWRRKKESVTQFINKEVDELALHLDYKKTLGQD